MNIPFVLKFLNKIELFQVIKKLDKQFDDQINSIDNYSKVIPLWQIEKKILFWTYRSHKHLGSPLKINDLKSKKSYLLRELNADNTGFNDARQKIKQINSDEIELNLTNKLQEMLEKVDDHDKEWLYKKIKRVGSGIYKIGLTAQEIEKVGARKVFGNLVSRGYAKFYPEIQKEFSHYEFNDGQIGRGVYEDAITTQYNCDGILITKDGMLMGELLNDLYYLKKIDKNCNRITIIYQQETYATYFLKKKKYMWWYYNLFLFVGYLALFLIIIIIFKELFRELYLFTKFLLCYY